MQELRVVGVRVELPGNQPILLLKETQGERYLPIWIGAVEAAAIAFEQQGVRPARPMTHDLLREVVRALGGGANPRHREAAGARGTVRAAAHGAAGVETPGPPAPLTPAYREGVRRGTRKQSRIA